MESTNTQNVTGLKYRASSVQGLIEQMVSLRKRRSKGEDVTIPSVMLQLTSGREIVGFVLDMIVGAQGTSVVVQTDIERGQPRVVYTDLSKVEAVSFLDLKSVKKPKPAPKPVQKSAPKLAQDSAQNLERPKAPVAQADAPVTVVATTQTRVPMISESDIQKLLMKFSSMWTMLFDSTVSVDVGWSSFSKSPRTLANLKVLIQNFRAAIEDLATSSRKEELRSQLQSVRFIHGASFDILIDSQTITVRGPLVGSSGELPSQTAMFNKIEAKLF